MNASDREYAMLYASFVSFYAAIQDSITCMHFYYTLLMTEKEGLKPEKDLITSSGISMLYESLCCQASLTSRLCYRVVERPQYYWHVLQVSRVPVHDVHFADVELVPVCSLSGCPGRAAGWLHHYLQFEAQPEGY